MRATAGASHDATHDLPAPMPIRPSTDQGGRHRSNSPIEVQAGGYDWLAGQPSVARHRHNLGCHDPEADGAAKAARLPGQRWLFHPGLPSLLRCARPS